jgi:hypothetical protein
MKKKQITIFIKDTKKITEGAAALALRNTSRTALSDSPTHLL